MAKNSNPQASTTPSPAPETEQAPMTRDEFTAAFQAMYRAALAVADNHGWCGQWYHTLRRIDPWFPSHTVETVALPEISLMDESWFTADGYAAYVASVTPDYRARMNLIRGRILYLVRNANVSLREANSVLAAGGMPEYVPPVPEQAQYYVNLGYTYFTAPTNLSRDQISTLRDALIAAFGSIGGSVTESSTDYLRPGAGLPVRVARTEQSLTIPDDQVSPLGTLVSGDDDE